MASQASLQKKRIEERTKIEYERQVEIVRSTVPVLKEHGSAITTSFYDTLLKEVPDLNNVFNQANQQNNHQAQALAGALYACASHIDDLGALSPAVEKICQKHASLYIKPQQYEVVGEYLLRAMSDVLGTAATMDVLDAWAAAYWQLADLMMKREKQLLQDAQGWMDWRRFRIAEKIEESAEITSFYLKPVDGQKLPSFKPGQYISVLMDVPQLGFQQSRQYSLSDAPNPSHYRISIKKERCTSVSPADAEAHPGFISNIMHDCKTVGDVIEVSHPAGEFFLDTEHDVNAPIVLFSAGVGLTPMISILNTLISRNTTLTQRIAFIHGARDTAVQAFGEHVRTTADSHANVTASIFIKNANTRTEVEGVNFHHAGRVRLEVLDRREDLCLDDQRTRYFVCGPNSFMADVHKGLRNLGVEGERVNMEIFGTGEVPKG